VRFRLKSTYEKKQQEIGKLFICKHISIVCAFCVHAPLTSIELGFTAFRGDHFIIVCVCVWQESGRKLKGLLGKKLPVRNNFKKNILFSSQNKFFFVLAYKYALKNTTSRVLFFYSLSKMKYIPQKKNLIKNRFI